VARLRIIGLALGPPTAFDGQFLCEYDPGRNGVDPLGHPMLAHMVTTPHPEQALDVPTPVLIALYQSTDPRRPIRPDGRMNRPLTAFSVEILP
jgi:hypothetical protein